MEAEPCLKIECDECFALIERAIHNKVDWFDIYDLEEDEEGFWAKEGDRSGKAACAEIVHVTREEILMFAVMEANNERGRS